MTPYFIDPWLTLWQGDCRDVLPTLPDASVDCVVTSPPYWGLRDYGTATWIGGDDLHAHVGVSIRTADTGGPKQQTKRGSIGVRSGDCECGAVRQDSQLGLEPTPEQYVANLVAVFREVRRVLKPSGTVWLNLGDTYSSGFMNGKQGAGSWVSHVGNTTQGRITTQRREPPAGLKVKDLVGIPWRVAFALQADGWYLRSDIIWSKPNPMPESVTDRPTKAHEYIFLLTKSARYFYDADAVREPHSSAPGGWKSYQPRGLVVHGNGETSQTDSRAGMGADPFGRNLRSVWTIATRPYPGAHFAVFPPELPERCIKAGSSERGVCPECGAPWERVVERGGGNYADRKARGVGGPYNLKPELYSPAGSMGGSEATTTGWRPSCRHETLRAQPAVVLDPFAGSGTVGLVANRLSRRAILIDLNADYIAQQMHRNAQTPLGLAEPA